MYSLTWKIALKLNTTSNKNFLKKHSHVYDAKKSNNICK